MRIGREPNILAYDTLCARLPDSDLDLAALEASTKLLDDDTSFVSSVTACTAQLGIERKQFRKMLTLTASLAVRYERNLWERFEESLAMRACTDGLNLKLLAYVEYASYDSADFKMRIRQSVEEQVSNPGLALPAPAPSAELALQPPPLESGTIVLKEENMIGTKNILQTACCVAVLLEINGRPAVIRGSQLTWLGSCDRNTSECYMAQLIKLRVATTTAEKFDRRVRVAVTDAAGSIGRTERGIAAFLKTWSLLHFLCRVHISAGIHVKVHELVRFFVSGLLGVSLSLNAAGQMQLLRRAARHVLKRNLRIVSNVILSDEA
jgi:hypothetical protein